MNEKFMQAAIIWWALCVKGHWAVDPNTTMLYQWEADLISVTKSSLFVHEFEIKTSKADYLKDFKKIRKHEWLGSALPNILGPNYFWYATYNFDIEPPRYAGWIKIIPNDKRYFDIEVKKNAPRLHKQKIEARDLAYMLHLLSWQLKGMYWDKYIDRPRKEAGL